MGAPLQQISDWHLYAVLEISTSASCKQGETKSSPGCHSIRHAVLQSARLSSFGFEQFARFVSSKFFPQPLLGFHQLTHRSNFDTQRLPSSNNSLGSSISPKPIGLSKRPRMAPVPSLSAPPGSAGFRSVPHPPLCSTSSLVFFRKFAAEPLSRWCFCITPNKCHPNVFLERTLTHEEQKGKGYHSTFTKSTIVLDRLNLNKSFSSPFIHPMKNCQHESTSSWHCPYLLFFMKTAPILLALKRHALSLHHVISSTRKACPFTS